MDTPFAGIICPVHGAVDIDYAEYLRQMCAPKHDWVCPTCGAAALFDALRCAELQPKISA